MNFTGTAKDYESKKQKSFYSSVTVCRTEIHTNSYELSSPNGYVGHVVSVLQIEYSE